MTINDTHKGGDMLQERRQRVFQVIDQILDAGDAAEATLAVPRGFQIEGIDFDLFPTGEISIAATGRPLVRLSAREAFALLTFLRVPGVAQLLDQVEAAEQAQNYREFLASEAAERAAGR